MRSAVRSAALLAAALLGACGDEPSVSQSATPTSAPRTGKYQITATVLESPKHGPQLCLGGVATSYPPQCGGPDIVGWDWAKAPSKESANGVTWGEAHVVGTFDGKTFTLTEPPGPPRRAQSATTGMDFSPGCATPDPGTASEAEASQSGGYGLTAVEDVVVATWVSDPQGEWDGPFTLTVLVRPGAADRVKKEVRQGYQGPLCVVERDQPTERELQKLSDEFFKDVGSSRERFGGVLGGGANGREGKVFVQVVLASDADRAEVKRRWGDKIVLVDTLQPA